MEWHTIVEFIVNKKVHYAIMYSHSKCGFLVKDEGLLCFDSLNELRKYCSEKDIFLREERKILNVKTLKNWISNETRKMSTKYIYNVWNILEKLSFSLGYNIHTEHKYNKDVIDVYEGIFYGIYLLSKGRREEEAHMVWSESEVSLICRIFNNGVNIIIDNIDPPERRSLTAV